MNNKRKIIILITIIAICILSGIMYIVYNNVIDKEIKIVDTEGKEVCFDEVPDRIISLIPSATENLYSMGALDSVIAVDEFSNYPESVSSKEKLKTSTNLNIEHIISLNPDLVVMSKMGQTVEQYNQLVNAGIKVVILDATSINDIYKTFDILGKILDKEKEAKNIIKDMKADIEDLKVINKSDKSVYIEISPLEWGLWTSGSGTFENEILELLGVKNTFNDVKSWVEVSEEQVVNRNPDYIISTYYMDNTNEIMSRSNWQNISAVKNKDVFMVNPDLLNRPTLRILEGIKLLKDKIYE